MSSLYEKTKEIIETESLSNAKKLLYGEDGLMRNNSEYYKRIITGFIQKKESILPKHGETIVYDIEKDVKDIWDILFIYEFVQGQWKNEQNEIRKERSRLKARYNKENDAEQKELLKKEIANLNLISNKINKHLQSVSIKNIKVLNENELYESDLIEERNNLKKAIAIIHKIRNELSHRNEKIEISETIKIDGDIKIEIPADYLEGFSKGRIIAKAEDIDYKKNADNIANSLIMRINHNPDIASSIFYRIRPDMLEYIIKLYDYDMEKVYSLPEHLFKLPLNDFIKITKFAKNEGLSLNVISKMAGYGRKNLDKIIRRYFELKSEGIDKKFFENLTAGGYYNKDKINQIIEVFGQEGIDLEYLKYVYPTAGFSVGEYRKLLKYMKNNAIDWENLKYLRSESYHNIDKTITLLKELKENGEDFSYIGYAYKAKNSSGLQTEDGEILTAMTTTLFECKPEVVVNIFKYIKEKEIKKEEINRLFYPPLEIDDFAKTRKILDFFSNEGIPFEYLSTIADIVNRKEGIDILNSIKEKGYFGYDKVRIMRIVNAMYKDRVKSKDLDYNEIIEMIEFFKNEGLTNVFILYDTTDFKRDKDKIKNTIMTLKNDYNLSPSTINKIISSVRFKDVCNRKIISFIEDNQLGEDLINKIPRHAFFDLTKTTELVKNLKGAGLDISILKILSGYEYNNPIEATEIIKFCIEENINLSYLKKLTFDSFESIDNTKALLKYLNDNDINSEYISNLPQKSYSESDYFKELAEYFKKENMDLEILNNLPGSIDIRVLNSHRDNIKFLTNLVGDNYEKLREFPPELFAIKTDYMESALTQYNTNVMRSLFGIDNPKQIAAIIYANNVLTKYSINNKNMKGIWNIGTEVNLALYNYSTDLLNRNNLKGLINRLSVRNHVLERTANLGLMKKTNLLRPINTVKRYYIYQLEKMRNASAHLRFKPSISSNHITLYDEDNNGNKNYEASFRIDEFVSIIHNIEEKMKSQDVIPLENRIIHEEAKGKVH